MPDKNQEHVIIVGAGPVGLTLALLLNSYGHKVVVFERHANHYPLPRAVGLSHENIRIYDSLGLRDELVSQGALAFIRDSVGEMQEWIGADGQILLRVPFNGPSRSGGDLGCALHQPSLERVLEAVCKERGVHLLRSTTVVNVVDMSTHVEVATTGPEGAHNWRSLFVIGCDGANSTVRESSGLAMSYYPGVRSRWLVADIIPKFENSEDAWKGHCPPRQYLDTKRPRTLVPSPKYRRRWEFMLLPDEDSKKASDSDFLWSLLAEYNCSPSNAVIERSAEYTLKGGCCESQNKGRILLSGDAAHVMPPFLAQGVNSGLRDAFTLSWRLDLALRYQQCNWEKLLSDWTSEQMGITKEIVQAAVHLENLYSITDPIQAKQRDMRIPQMPPPKLRLEQVAAPGMFVSATGVNLAPENAPGHMFIDDVVQIEGRKGRLCDLLDSHSWLVLSVSTSRDSNMYDLNTGLRERLTKAFRVKELVVGSNLHDTTGRFTAWFQETGVYAVIVRPDHYIYGIAKTQDDIKGLLHDALDYVGC